MRCPAARSNVAAMPARLAIALVAVVALTGLVACGKSDEEKATAQACDARADIAKQVESLQKLTASTVTVDAVSGSVKAIGDDVAKIRDAQDKLSEQRRKEFKAATDAFATKVSDIGSTVLRSTSLSDAAAQLQSATTELVQSYRSTLGGVDCG